MSLYAFLVISLVLKALKEPNVDNLRCKTDVFAKLKYKLCRRVTY